ncbi:MAG: class II aldolase/adducin family protein [Telmatospirillum sp.]|nr:class II aldolase/adducin family protein [Telmatospirillum sp.]
MTGRSYGFAEWILGLSLVPKLLAENHGLVVAGKTLDDVVRAMEDLEETAKLHLVLTGRAIRFLNQP